MACAPFVLEIPPGVAFPIRRRPRRAAQRAEVVFLHRGGRWEAESELLRRIDLGLRPVPGKAPSPRDRHRRRNPAEFPGTMWRNVLKFGLRPPAEWRRAGGAPGLPKPENLIL